MTQSNDTPRRDNKPAFGPAEAAHGSASRHGRGKTEKFPEAMKTFLNILLLTAFPGAGAYFAIAGTIFTIVGRKCW